MSLFERNKNIKADLIEDKILKIEVSMLDNVHHISTIYHVLFPEKIIKFAAADFKKAPYVEVCKLMSNKMKNIVGLKINHGFTQRIIEILGGESGCHHLVDHVLEMAKSLAQFIDKSSPLPLPFKEYIEDAPLLRKTILNQYPKVKNMCWAYNIENNHLFTKKVKCGLQSELVI